MVALRVTLLLAALAAAAAQGGQDCPRGAPALWAKAQAGGGGWREPCTAPSSACAASHGCLPPPPLQDFELPDAEGTKAVFGEPVQFAGGSVRVYARMTGPCDPPAAVGVELAPNMLDDLPGPDEVSMQPPPECRATPMLPQCFPPFDVVFMPFFDEEAPGWNPYRVLELDWNPTGHHPPGVYNAPHFDVHFYLVNQSAIEAISGGGNCSGLPPAVFAEAHRPIPKECFPGGGWSDINAVAPMMGNHLVDMASPEMQAFAAGGNAVGAWNSTYIWGAFGGEITFFEVMVKRSFLMNATDFCAPIPGLPSQFAIEGYKPSTYCILSTENGTLIELRDYEWYDAECRGTDYAPASYMMLPPGSPPLPPECEAVVPKMAASAGGAAPAPQPAQPASAATGRNASGLVALAATLAAALAAAAV